MGLPCRPCRFGSLRQDRYTPLPRQRTERVLRKPTYTLQDRPGEESFLAQLLGAGGVEFRGRARPQPQIHENGIRDAASLLVPTRFAPGSYISIFGAGLSESTAVFRTPYLPLSLAGVSVSFDVPSAGIHAPGTYLRQRRSDQCADSVGTGGGPTRRP